MADQEQDNGNRPFHLEASGVIFDKPKSNEEVASETRAREQHEFARSQVKTNKALAWFTGFLVLGTFCGTGISLWQGHISQQAANAAKAAAITATQTLNEMRTGSGATDTHTLAQQAVTQAAQTTALAKASQKQADQTERLANDAVTQAKAANALAAQAQRSADYAKLSIDNAIDAERPWIGVNSFNADDFVETHTAKLRFSYINSGKRPATVSSFYSAQVLERMPTFPLVSVSDPSQSFVLPGAASSATFDYEVPEHAFADWKKRRRTLYFFVDIAYTDVGTNAAHLTHFCVRYEPGNKEMLWPLCPSYNEAK